VWANRVVQQGVRTATELSFGNFYITWHPWFGLRVGVHEAIDKSGGIVFRCNLSGAGTDRWLEVPAWMFDRSACVRVRLVADAHINLTGSLLFVLLTADGGGSLQVLSSSLGGGGGGSRGLHRPVSLPLAFPQASVHTCGPTCAWAFLELFQRARVAG
jgi:hypothetical protein